MPKLEKNPKAELAVPTIVQRGDSILRGDATAVPIKEIASKKIQKIVADMATAMHSQKDGVAIAAPQIGVPLQIFVVNGALLSQADKSYKGGKSDLVFINPQILKLSKEKKDVEEGCLSVRWKYGVVSRSAKATIKYFDENGKERSRGAGGLLAQIFQHEVDHLNGELFTDKAKQTWDMTDEEIAELQGK
jgi:peptide deformylase